MGEMADAAINGECCSWCGVFFNGEHGFPVLCVSCWSGAKPTERAEFSQARRSEL